MTNDKYAKSYKEILEIIKYFPEEEYNKIPKEIIKYYKENMDSNYDFSINPNIDLSEQNISKETNAIIIMLFQDYFATEEQKLKIDKVLELNEKKAEVEKKKKYNSDELFKIKQPDSLNIENTEIIQNTALVEHKETFFKKFKKFVKRLLHIDS